PIPGKPAAITMRFDVDESFEPGEFRASGATLSYNPTTAADTRDDRTKPAVSLPPHWIGSNAEWIEF
ncbi:hypothetical protein, partial [Microbacterium sp.]|uniref:hypothetical protein n=1 Tax=Microbacterium sp. TaxID=51671 RepID=UPI002E36C99C